MAPCVQGLGVHYFNCWRNWNAISFAHRVCFKQSVPLATSTSRMASSLSIIWRLRRCQFPAIPKRRPELPGSTPPKIAIRSQGSPAEKPRLLLLNGPLSGFSREDGHQGLPRVDRMSDRVRTNTADLNPMSESSAARLLCDSQLAKNKRIFEGGLMVALKAP